MVEPTTRVTHVHEIFDYIAILGLVVVGVNATAYRVQETEKAILLNFGNLVDADIRPGLHFKMPIAEEVKNLMAGC